MYLFYGQASFSYWRLLIESIIDIRYWTASVIFEYCPRNFKRRVYIILAVCVAYGALFTWYRNMINPVLDQVFSVLKVEVEIVQL